MTIEEAIDVFVGGFCLTKSEPYPYVCDRQLDLWVMHDGPGRGQSPRKTEVVVTGLHPEEVVARISRLSLPWHFLCHIHPDADEFAGIRASYKSLGYRALSSESMFVHDLIQIPALDCEPAVREVMDRAMADSIPKEGREAAKFIPQSRLFASWDDQAFYGRVRSVPVGKSAWVSDLKVRHQDRRKGIGRALMSALLRSDKVHGMQASVLLASSDGARLYPHLGYRSIGILQMFCPAKRF